VRLADDRRGAAAILFALAAMPVLAALGLAADATTGYLVAGRLQKSLDAAALAAGGAADAATAASAAREIFDVNFAPGSQVEVTGFSVLPDPGRRRVTLRAEARLPTVFMRIFGRESIDLAAESTERLVSWRRAGAPSALPRRRRGRA
jgi:uncharacterized membrane protein